MELRSLPFNMKNKYSPAVRNFRADYDSLKAEFVKAKSSTRSTGQGVEDVRARLLESDQALQNMEDSLMNSRF